MSMRIGFLVLAAAMALSACQTQPHAPEAQAPEALAKAEQIATGEEVAARNCARCHALGATAQSPRPEAPPLRQLASRYRTEVLHEELVAGLHFGIADMPTFSLSLAESDALTAYLNAIAEPATASPQP